MIHPTPTALPPLALLLLAASGCGPLRMKPPSGSFERLSVHTGANPTQPGTPHVGPWALTTGEIPHEGPFRYQLSQGDSSLAGECRYRGDQRSQAERHAPIIEAGIAQEQTLRCACGADAQLAVELGTKGGRQGLSLGPRALRLKASHAATKGRETVEPVGFYVTDGATRVAAVEVVSPGQIWLGPGVAPAERLPLACLLTGLMLAPLE